MATNSIKTVGTVNATYTINNLPYTADYSENLVPLGTASFALTTTINTGSWQALYTTSSISIVDVGVVYIDNPSGPGTVQFSTGSNGQNIVATESPTDWTKLAWTGSITLYAKAMDTASAINVIIVPN